MALPAGAGELNPPKPKNPATGSTGVNPGVASGAPTNDLASVLGPLAQMMSGDQSSFLNQEYGFQKQRLGLQGQGDAITKAALLRQLGLLGSEYGLQQQGFKQQHGDIVYGEQRQMEGFRGSEGARGAAGTKGSKTGMADIRRQMTEQLATLGRTEKGAALSYKEQKAEINDKLKKLGLLAKERGLSLKELWAQLQNNLQKSGLSNFFSMVDLTNALTQGALGQEAGAGGLAGYFLGAGGG